jgi:high affinity Mn2+ porin
LKKGLKSYKFLAVVVSILLAMSGRTRGQSDDGANLSFHFQQTIIVQNHDKFSSPYYGTNSLSSNEPPAMTLTSTFFFHGELKSLFGVELDPELVGGKGLSGSTGVAGFPNGEAYRVNDVAPKLGLARIYLSKRIDINGDRYLDFIAGRFSIADYFDANAYSNSPRTQFLNWALINNGAWDYPADTRGYTAGVVAEYHFGRSALRLAIVMEPSTANGPNLDMHVTKAHGQALEDETRYTLFGREGKIRTLLFYNVANMGNYKEAVNDTAYHHDITLTRKYGRSKYGFGINVEQGLNKSAGAFLRVGWNDGQNETWAYTEIDRTISGGVTFDLSAVERPKDNLGAAIVFNGISQAHRAYLNSGGYGFIIGDGRLPHYGTEFIFETYYLFQLYNSLAITLDYQHVENPAYNRDRGPVNFGAVRVHFEI